MSMKHPTAAVTAAAESRHLPMVDEQRWVVQIRAALAEDVSNDTPVPVSVFCVPKSMMECKPEAYVPQLFAVGPYHHWQSHLYEMERYKLATAKRTERQLAGDAKLPLLAEEFIKNEKKIRSHYHRYLEFSNETLGWMMVIDVSFLLEFLRNYSDSDAKSTYRRVPSMNHMVDAARIKLAYNAIVRDVVMLENQIPLFLVRKIMHFQSTAPAEADDQLINMLIGFAREISPFRAASENITGVDLGRHPHLLAFLYSLIVPSIKEESRVGDDDIEQQTEVELDGGGEEGTAGYVRQVFDLAWKTEKESQGIAYRTVKRVLNSRPLRAVVQVPWKIISRLPFISLLKGPMESMFCFKGDEGGEQEDSSSAGGNKPPLIEEIFIPSVTQLTSAGVRFAPIPNNGGITAIAFETCTATLYLPKVSLDCNTEILLRNLMAYEASVVPGPTVFARYTELMNGIIDTEEDVTLLRRSGVVENRMKSDGEVAALWNDMRKSVRLTKVAYIDKVLVEVNKHYANRWKIKAEKFMKTYVLGSWKLLTFFAALLLLLLTCVQAFCSVYTCGRGLRAVSDVGGD